MFLLLFYYRTNDQLKALSQIISDDQLLILWEKLLFNLNEDLKRTQDHFIQLETLMNSRENKHNAYIKKLFEDMDTLLKDEKDRAVEEEAKKFKMYQEHIADELYKKNEDLRLLKEQKNQLDMKLTESLRQETKNKMLVKSVASEHVNIFNVNYYLLIHIIQLSYQE